jgi:hypothetical protein
VENKTQLQGFETYLKSEPVTTILEQAIWPIKLNAFYY